MSNEDIRRSLEVLDSVLAEFDDCLETWDSPQVPKDFTHSSSDSIKILESSDFNSDVMKYSHASTGDQFHCQTYPRDGSTSHNFYSNSPEQPRVGSPPPIPKRSPATKLSERNASLFPFPSLDDTSLDSYDSSNRSDVSPTNQISNELSPPEKNDDCDNRSKPPDKCSNCGRGLKNTTSVMELSAENNEFPSSPFLQKKQMFEAKIADATVSKSPILNRPSFRQKRVSQRLETGFEPSSESGFENGSASQDSNDSVSLTIASVTREDAASPSRYHAANCSCKEKIRQLNAKFSDVRRLLKSDKIKGLEQKPPSFNPPPPPVLNQQTNHHVPELDQLLTNSSPISKRENLPKPTVENSSPVDSSSPMYNSPSTENSSSAFQNSKVRSSSCVDDCIEPTSNSLETSIDDFKRTDSHILCNRCSSSHSHSSHLSETIEDLPHLLPTDALNRPQLGLSYSMEEDLSPGVKEIRQTSTPKSDVSSPSLFRTKESNLSTFSHSASSLGYVSSQSDLELNNLSILPDKVPVSSFKSRTLPNGLDRSPFYSPMDEVHLSAGEVNDYNDNRLPVGKKSDRLSGVVSDLRSSSAPPPPQPEKTKTKHFRVFSRKEKKDKKKSEDTSSLKSNLSLDEGIILKKLGTLDGSTVSLILDGAADKKEVEIEKKRRSIWHSIKGKK